MPWPSQYTDRLCFQFYFPRTLLSYFALELRVFKTKHLRTVPETGSRMQKLETNPLFKSQFSRGLIPESLVKKTQFKKLNLLSNLDMSFFLLFILCIRSHLFADRKGHLNYEFCSLTIGYQPDPLDSKRLGLVIQLGLTLHQFQKKNGW